MTTPQRPRIAVVLAAGKGTRMKSALPKVLHPVLGKPMLQRVLESLSGLSLDKVFVVIGHGSEQVTQALQGFTLPFSVETVIQEPQLGTGHAVMQVLPKHPASVQSDLLITCGDMPLVPAQRYETLWQAYDSLRPTAMMASVEMLDPTGYGRVLTDAAGRFIRIVEEKDATPEERAVDAVNPGVYLADWPKLAEALGKLDQNNAQGEFYLTDALGIMAREGDGAVHVQPWPDEDEVLGINSRAQLAEANQILSRWTCERLMAQGVTVYQPQTQLLAPEITVGADSILYPGCVMVGDVTIGANSEVGPHTTMRGDITIGQGSRVIQSYLDRKVSIGDNTLIGPFAHLRDNASIGSQVIIGNFVEVKEAEFGDRSNAAHLAYLGDVTIGEDVNMGAGSIIANYDPIRDTKHRSTLADGVKVGCNSVLVSPVMIGERASVAAGSVITDDVAPYDLAIARARQSVLPRWVEKTLGKLLK